MTFIEILGVLTVSVLSAGLVLAYCMRGSRGLSKRARVSPSSPISFLFEDNSMIHATPLARSLLRGESEQARWSDVRSIFATRFPTLPTKPPRVGTEALDVDSVDPEDQAVLRIESVGRHTRFELVEAEDDPSFKNSHMLRSLQVLHQRVDEMCQTAPFPMWRLDNKGNVAWSNAAYDALARSAGSAPLLKGTDPHHGRRRNRVSVELGSPDKVAWYDVSSVPVDAGTACHANNIDAVIQAEIAQRNFVQTLAKTFAQLSTGLAIFDRKRQLVLFNPALIDLTGLQAEFLSARPELMTFFDNLRDRRIMPEPKNYATWRQEITSVIEAAADGRYEETWSLDNGQTYRVTGRPHPDGAVAFLIEDISAEMSMTRNIRTELEQCKAVLKALESPVAVFSPTGMLTYCNPAYEALFGLNEGINFADLSLSDCMKLWQAKMKPNPAWGELREFTLKLSERAAWDAIVESKDNQAFALSVTPLASGATSLQLSGLALSPPIAESA